MAPNIPVNANATYPALDYRLKAEGCKNFFIGTVEGYPDLETVKKEVEAIHAKGGSGSADGGCR